MPQKLVIDADPGLADAVAIGLALADPALDVLALTAVAGVVSAAQAARNLTSIVAAIDPPKWPRIGIGERPTCDVLPEDWRRDALLLQGETGLGPIPIVDNEKHHAKEAAKLLCDLVKSNPQEIVLLTLGPLTNVAAACERDTDFLHRLQGLVMVGGAVSCPGDVTAVSEFNFHADAESAQRLLATSVPKTLVPRDVTSRIELTFDAFGRWSESVRSSVGTFLGQTVGHLLRTHRQHLGQEGLSLSEVAGVFAVSQPRAALRTPSCVAVETKGELTRGMTIVDRRVRRCNRPNVDVVHELDPQRVLDYLVNMARRPDS